MQKSHAAQPPACLICSKYHVKKLLDKKKNTYTKDQKASLEQFLKQISEVIQTIMFTEKLRLPKLFSEIFLLRKLQVIQCIIQQRPYE